WRGLRSRWHCWCRSCVLVSLCQRIRRLGVDTFQTLCLKLLSEGQDVEFGRHALPLAHQVDPDRSPSLGVERLAVAGEGAAEDPGHLIENAPVEAAPRGRGEHRAKVIVRLAPRVLLALPPALLGRGTAQRPLLPAAHCRPPAGGATPPSPASICVRALFPLVSVSESVFAPCATCCAASSCCAACCCACRSARMAATSSTSRSILEGVPSMSA